MKKRYVKWLALFMVMIFALSGCGASADKGGMSESEAYDAMAQAPMAEPKEEAVAEEGTIETTEGSGSGVQADEIKDTSRKLIKRYYLNLETREYDTLVEYIQTSVEATGGYIESSNLSGASIDGYGTRSAYFVFRIPVSDAVSFIDGLEENGHVTHKSEEVEDVTLAYVDTESRIEALRIEQESLMEMLKEAKELDTILALQNRLTEVRYELESYESQIRSYDNLIEYTTVSVDVYEVKRETSTNDGSFTERLKDNFSDGFYNFGEGVQNFIIWFAGAIPTLLMLAVIAIVVVIVIRKAGKRRRESNHLKSVLKKSTFEDESGKDE